VLPLALTIALRHLAKRRRQTLVSVLGVALGVGFFIGMTALMRGFQTYFVAQVIDVAPHITIKDEYRSPRVQPAVLVHADGAVAVRGVKPREELRGIRDARGMIASLEDIPGVAVAPGLRGAALLRYGARDVTATIAGIEPARERRVGNIEKDMISGTLDDLRATANGIIVGIGLSERLGAGRGDTITVVAPSGDALSFKIVGIVATGITAIDNGEAYVLLKLSQVLQDRPNVINAIRIRLDDVTQAEPLARRIEAAYGWRTESWEEANRNVLNLFVIQNAIMYSVVGAILLVAAFGIYSIISTVVHEKARDIAILKSLGFTEGDILRVFTIEGVMVGVAGAVCGALVGEALIFGLGQVKFEQAGGFIRGTGGFLLARELWPYIAGSGFAVIASAVAALIPARKAAALNPVDIVRGAA
jgi:lipoprotein-releasing system permease protein